MTQGRIIKGVGGIYTIASHDGIYTCNVRGIFRKQNITPTIGDFVEIDMIDETNMTGTISRFEKRKNRLLRPSVSNIDLVIIVFAAHSPNINVDLLDRFILLAEEQDLKIIICVNKIDLSNDYLNIMEIYKKIGYEVIGISVLKELGFNELKPHLYRKVSVVAGPSGVGKSSIINMLVPQAKMQVGELSAKIKRGKHTTRHVELLEMAEESYIVDSPGFTSLSIEHINIADLAGYFKEFRSFCHDCRFDDCRHISEPECAVKEQVGGSIAPERYSRYVRLYEELLNMR